MSFPGTSWRPVELGRVLRGKVSTSLTPSFFRLVPEMSLMTFRTIFELGLRYGGRNHLNDSWIGHSLSVFTYSGLK